VYEVVQDYPAADLPVRVQVPVSVQEHHHAAGCDGSYRAGR
jgi:hypothetical protein